MSAAVGAAAEGVELAAEAAAAAAARARVGRNAQARRLRVVRGALEALADLDDHLRGFLRHLSNDHPASLVLDLLENELPHSEDQLESSRGSEILWHCRLLVLVGDLGGFDPDRRGVCSAMMNSSTPPGAPFPSWRHTGMIEARGTQASCAIFVRRA